MSLALEVRYQNSFVANKPLAQTFAWLSDVEKQIPATFPGVESFRRLEDGSYEWKFRKLEYGGQSVQILLLTRFVLKAPHQIDIESIEAPQHSRFSGTWHLTEQDNAATRLQFNATFGVELKIPFFLKAVAEPLAQKELTKLFDRYLNNVEKALAV